MTNPNLAEHLATNGFVIIDALSRPFYVCEQTKWLSGWHPGKYWVRQREINDAFIAQWEPEAIPADQAQLYHDLHEKEWGWVSEAFKRPEGESQ